MSLSSYLYFRHLISIKQIMTLVYHKKNIFFISKYIHLMILATLKVESCQDNKEHMYLDSRELKCQAIEIIMIINGKRSIIE